jgi:hypothetical protein
METDTQSFIEEEDFDDDDTGKVGGEATNVKEEVSDNNFNFSTGFLPANEEITKLGGLVSELSQQSQENSLILREIGVELLAQSIVLKALHQHQNKLDIGIKQVVETAIKNQPNPVIALEESIKQIQEQARILIKARKPQASEAITGSHPFSRKAIALMVVAQTVIVATATTLTINYFPPKASVKTEQQWYSIFQRVDQLYKAKFGNVPPKK